MRLSYSTIDCGYVTKRLLNAQVNLDFKHQTFGPNHAKNLHKPMNYSIRSEADPRYAQTVYVLRVDGLWREVLGDPRIQGRVDDYTMKMAGSGILREMRHQLFARMLRVSIPRGYRRALEEVCRALRFKTTDCAILRRL